ncbi:glycosyltransferase family 4 protein [Thermotoga sp.]|uniref:glycosyltransferase family 4 protein n=1 Tax=Thermotoga sp. TaxID=28240 RepID=UPI0025F8DBB5|nr:MraY family glycosyltransferase [Thermotoga sp.]MCD6552129.1 undecaprenyl/decaprenyl-phosphate alpha-N-acetylglucosaminyl 1-phosphate transferase [Thermotoga sp.]
MPFFLGFLLGVLGVWFFGRLAKKLNIVDKPDGLLKPHGREIPYLGGLGIFAGVLPFLWSDTAVLLTSSLALTLGLLDDLFSLSPFFRLMMEFGISLILVWKFVGFYSIWYSILWVLFVVILVNAVNMMDGMDGLCGSLVAISSLFFFFLVKGSFFQDLSLALLGTSLGYLVFNFPPARIFMGDAGSYLFAVLLSTMAVSQSRVVSFSSLVPLVFPLWTFLLDFSASVIRRFKNKKSIFSGDRDHMYDKLSRRLGVRRSLFIMCLIHSLFCGFSFGAMGNTFTGVLSLAVAGIFSYLLIKSLKLFDYD